MGLKPVCVPCERFMRPVRNGYAFVEGMPVGNKQKPGKTNPSGWVPYKLWFGDKWGCPDCGASIIVGFAKKPIVEQHQPEFAANVVSHGATLIVKDC